MTTQAARTRYINRMLSNRWAKVVVFVLALVPFLMLVRAILVTHDLTANPIEYIQHYTGTWTLRFVLIALAVTPLRVWLKRPLLTRFRRMLGLFAFFYAVLHILTWAGLDQHFTGSLMLQDILARKYITVGMAAFVMLIILALTSTSGWVRRLGYLRWQRLHRVVYLVPLLGVIHYYWSVKSDVRLPLLYGALFIILMLVRIPIWNKDARASRRRRARVEAAQDTAA